MHQILDINKQFEEGVDNDYLLKDCSSEIDKHSQTSNKIQEDNSDQKPIQMMKVRSKSIEKNKKEP